MIVLKERSLFSNCSIFCLSFLLSNVYYKMSLRKPFQILWMYESHFKKFFPGCLNILTKPMNRHTSLSVETPIHRSPCWILQLQVRAMTEHSSANGMNSWPLVGSSALSIWFSRRYTLRVKCQIVQMTISAHSWRSRLFEECQFQKWPRSLPRHALVKPFSSEPFKSGELDSELVRMRFEIFLTALQLLSNRLQRRKWKFFLIWQAIDMCGTW